MSAATWQERAQCALDDAELPDARADGQVETAPVGLLLILPMGEGALRRVLGVVREVGLARRGRPAVRSRRDAATG